MHRVGRDGLIEVGLCSIGVVTTGGLLVVTGVGLAKVLGLTSVWLLENTTEYSWRLRVAVATCTEHLEIRRWR